MPANTPNRSYTYATSDDANDLAFISQRLAEQIDADVAALFTSRDAQIPAGRIYRTATMSAPTGAWTEIPAWTSESYRRGGINYVAPRYVVSRAGIYNLIGQASWVSSTTGRRGVSFTRNGVVGPGQPDDQMVSPTQNAGAPTYQVSGAAYLNAGDSIGLAVYQDSGTAATMSLASLTVVFAGN